ncbi:hypothetical protein ACIQMJ_12085 [Actinosynnema sp. NPDC091369]
MATTAEIAPQRISPQEALRGTPVHIDHAYTGQHLNTQGFAGAPGVCFLFDDHDDNNWPGEVWIIEQQSDGTVQIKNDKTGRLLAAKSVPTYELFRTPVVLSPDDTTLPAGYKWETRWVLHRTGIEDAFIIRPAGDQTLAISPEAGQPLGVVGNVLHVLNEGPYLNQLFTLTRVWPDQKGRAHGGGHRPAARD